MRPLDTGAAGAAELLDLLGDVLRRDALRQRFSCFWRERRVGEGARQALVPFYTTKPGGSGLGLALSNEIVEAHGGRMRLSAREGGGTVVTCWVPAG